MSIGEPLLVWSQVRQLSSNSSQCGTTSSRGGTIRILQVGIRRVGKHSATSKRIHTCQHDEGWCCRRFCKPGIRWNTDDRQGVRGPPRILLLVILDPFSSCTWCTCHRWLCTCLLYTSPSPRDATLSRMPSSA